MAGWLVVVGGGSLAGVVLVEEVVLVEGGAEGWLEGGVLGAVVEGSL